LGRVRSWGWRHRRLATAMYFYSSLINSLIAVPGLFRGATLLPGEEFRPDPPPQCRGAGVLPGGAHNDAVGPHRAMDLANMRQNGVHSLDVQCDNCRHRMIVNVDHLPGDLMVPSFRRRMVCKNAGLSAPTCGRTGKNIRCYAGGAGRRPRLPFIPALLPAGNQTGLRYCYDAR